MRYLRQNTAVIVSVGPFYDRTDGVTIENALTITNERITLVADTDAGSAPTIILDNVTGATSGTDNDLNYITGIDAGIMQLELSAANTNRLGRLLLSITDAANHVPVFHEFMILPQQVYDSLILGSDLLDANASQLGGTAQTGRDVGASVLLSSGTGAGQLDFTSGVVKSNLVSILATALTETAGQIAAAFKKFFDVATPTGTVDSIPDAAPGASGGLLIAGSNANTTVNITGNITGNLSGSVGSVTAGVTLVNPQGIKKNTALNAFEFVMFDSSGDPTTGLTVSGQRSIDGGAFGAVANSVAEVALGVYKLDLANTDLNGDVITFVFTASGAMATIVTIKTVVA